MNELRQRIGLIAEHGHDDVILDGLELFLGLLNVLGHLEQHLHEFSLVCLAAANDRGVEGVEEGVLGIEAEVFVLALAKGAFDVVLELVRA